MKRLLGLLGVVCTLAASALGQGPGPAPVPWPDVTLTTRDYSGNIPATDRYHYPGTHPAIEKSLTSAVTHVVYVRGSTIVMDVTWRNDNDFALTGTVTWQAARLRVPGPNQNPADQFITLNVSGSVAISLPANGESAPIPLTITGVPNYVAVGQLEIKYDLPLTKAPGQTGNNGTYGNYHGWERIPLIDAAPVGLQETPWADLCEYSCRWAFGYSGTTDVRRELTRGLHYSNRAPWNRTNYNPSAGLYYPRYNALGQEWVSEFRLGLLLQHLGDPWMSSGPEVGYTAMYCASYAATLNQAMATHGLDSDCRFLARTTGGFYTWPLCPAGTDSTIKAFYKSYNFSWHLVVIEAARIYDAAPSYYYDTSGGGWMNPAWDWISDDYWQNPPGLYGLAYGTSSCTPFWPIYDPANGYDWDTSNPETFNNVSQLDGKAPPALKGLND